MRKSRLPGAATPTAAGPTEMSFGNGDRFLCVLSPGANALNPFTADAAGHLASIGPVTSRPAGLNGTIAR